jgi:hypothetical protein
LGTKSPYLIPPFVNWGQRGFFLYERGKRKSWNGLEVIEAIEEFSFCVEITS